MKFLLIPDKFKGSLSATEVIDAISRGINDAIANAEIRNILASDGGDGFLDAVKSYQQVEEIVIDTIDPLGRPIKAPYLFDKTNKKAYLELASASGLVLLEDKERNALKTSTQGSGIQIKHAIDLGARTIYLGLGGSATNDGGTGIAHVLGYNFLDKDRASLDPVGESLNSIETIDTDAAYKEIETVSFFAVNDVNNPLFGPEGAAYVYGPQKGANIDEVKILDEGLRQLDKTVKQTLGSEIAEIPGSGAAGGRCLWVKSIFERRICKRY